MSTSFADLGLSSEVLEAIAKKGFEEPTEIQAKAIPLMLASDQDIIAQAQTGTGKTATFGLVFTDQLQPRKSKAPQAIVLAPTRELAIQVSEELNSLKGSKKLSIVPIYGGQSWGMQRKHLMAGVDIVVGTPGRVMEHLDKKTLKLDELRYFVLDEADEMLNMGFIEDIEKIMEYANPERKVLLFSATMPTRIAHLAKKYMTNPVSIKTQKDKITNNAVDQIYFEVSNHHKFEALCRIIDMEDDFYGIVFCRTKIAVDQVSKQLSDRGYKAEAFHGDISQDRREQILRGFKNRKVEALVATDVAARGIDVNDLSHVINYALPQNSESYVHRIGRTGRAGKDGKAITLITPAESRKLRSFEYQAKAKIKKEEVPDAKAMVEFKKQKLIGELTSILEKGELGTYKNMATSLLEEEDPKTILAALLKHSFAESLDPNEYDDLKARGRGSVRADRPDRGARDTQRGSQSHLNKYGSARLFITTGRKDGANPGKILQMIDNDFGVPGSSVGQIEIMEDYSFISVPLKEAETILDAFHDMKRAGKYAPVRVERAQHDKKSGLGKGGVKKKKGFKKGGKGGSFTGRKPFGKKS